jgi:PAS domain S-box-containing protein
MDVNVKALIDNLSIGIQILDQDGIFRYINDGMVRLTGIPKSAIVGKRYSDFLSEGQLSINEKVFREKRQVTLFQDIQRPEKGSYRQIITSTPVFDAEGNVKHVIAVAERLSDMESRLRTAQNSEISQMSYAASEDVDNDRQDIIAESEAMKGILALAERIANVDSSILILGESGAGKEVIAQYIHRCGNRARREMVEINCASLPESLLEAELFGYVKGAFTGASAQGKQGLIEAADKGILFLDEINSMPLSVQSKLLRVIETGELRRIGAVSGAKVDFRLIAASNCNLLKLVEGGSFRADLYYRLNVIPIEMPPLRDRIEDVIPLADHFAKELGKRYGKVKTFAKEAYAQMTGYDWPGNVRELRNVIERLIVTTSDDVMEISNIPQSFFSVPVSREEFRDDASPLPALFSKSVDALTKSEDVSLADYMDDCEKAVLEYVLRKYKNTYKAAEILKIGQSSVIRKKQKYDIRY